MKALAERHSYWLLKTFLENQIPFYLLKSATVMDVLLKTSWKKELALNPISRQFPGVSAFRSSPSFLAGATMLVLPGNPRQWWSNVRIPGSIHFCPVCDFSNRYLFLWSFQMGWPRLCWVFSVVWGSLFPFLLLPQDHSLEVFFSQSPSFPFDHSWAILSNRPLVLLTLSASASQKIQPMHRASSNILMWN